MEGVLGIVFACGLILLSLWWLIHLVYNYHRSQQYHECFHSLLVTHHKLCKVLSIEGTAEFIFGVAMTISALMTENSSNFIQNTEIGTISIFVSFLGIHNIATSYNKKPFLDGLEVVLTSAVFLVLAVIFYGNSSAHEYHISSIYSLSSLTSVSIATCIFTEWKYPKEVVIGLVRNFLVLLLGTWTIHSQFLISESFFPLPLNEFPVQMAVYFTWHCGINFLLILCVWNVVYKLCDKNYCYCLSNPQNCDIVYLENRVHFDMGILGRLEESENEEP